MKGPALRTRIADRANAAVWRLPVPRRARVLLGRRRNLAALPIAIQQGSQNV